MGSTFNTPDAALVGKHTHGFFEDFNYYIADDLFTVTSADGGSASETDAAGGVLSLDTSSTTAADNDEVYLHQSNETFLFAAEKPLQFDARIQFTEANTDDANVAVGLSDAVAADRIVDGGGMAASFDGAVIHKDDGGTVWKFTTSNATAQTTSTSTTTAGGSAYQVLTIIVRHQDASNCSLVPLVDGQQLKDSNGNLIEHKLAYSGLAEMEAFIGLKGGSTNEESLLVDYISCWQKR